MGGESLGQAAAALEFALEGLYLMRRLSKDSARRRRGLPDLSSGARGLTMSGYRYGPYPADQIRWSRPTTSAGAVDALGESVLEGTDPAAALRDLLRRGMSGHRGLDDMLRRVRERQREVRNRGRLDGVLEQVRAMLDKAIGEERAELFPDPSDDRADARGRAGLGAVRHLARDPAAADYDWQSATARQTFEELKDLLRREILDSQFQRHEADA